MPKQRDRGFSSGSVSLAHITSGELTARTTSGSIRLNDVLAEKSLFVKSTSGGVALSGCDGGAIKITTVSGSITGTLLSDKVFMTRTISGSVRVPDSTTGGTCEIRTTSGDIDIVKDKP